jgi:hypothetical protein
MRKKQQDTRGRLGNIKDSLNCSDLSISTLSTQNPVPTHVPNHRTTGLKPRKETNTGRGTPATPLQEDLHTRLPHIHTHLHLRTQNTGNPRSNLHHRRNLHRHPHRRHLARSLIPLPRQTGNRTTRQAGGENIVRLLKVIRAKNNTEILWLRTR